MSPIKKDKILNGQLMSSTFVFFSEEKSLKSNRDINIVKLRHPSSNQPALFLFGPGDNSVCEILSFNESKRSWFINEHVKSDGKILISTPVDPIFLIIPYLKKLPNVEPLDQCLEDDDFPDTRRLANCRNLKLSLVADRKGDESFRAYKFNEEKALNWLNEKNKKLVEVIKKKNINVSQATVSANYVNSKYKSESEIDYVKYAHGIISEYLDEDLSTKLAKHLNLSDLVEVKKRKSSNPEEGAEKKKSKTEKIDPEDIELKKLIATPKTTPKSKQETVQKSTKKEQARQKAAAGSKSITSFFKKV